MAAVTAHETVRRWIKGWNDHDVDAFVDLLTDDYEEVTPTQALSGREAARADLIESFRSMPDISVEVTALCVDGPVAAVEYRMRAP